jgi:hypothetical protein
VGPRSDLDDVEKREFLTQRGLELRPLGRPAGSQSLYRLSYPVARLIGWRWELHGDESRGLIDDALLECWETAQ